MPKVNMWNQRLSILTLGERTDGLWVLVSTHMMEHEANIALMEAGKCNTDEGNSGGEYKHHWTSFSGPSISGQTYVCVTILNRYMHILNGILDSQLKLNFSNIICFLDKL